MTETIYNLFVYSDGECITHLGIFPYELADEGSDEEKYDFLQERALIDHAAAGKSGLVSPRITLSEFEAMQRLGKTLGLFHELFEICKAPKEVLFAMTVVVNGFPQVDHTYMGVPNLNEIPDREPMIDYLKHYMSPQGLDIPRLLNDDYFLAIKLLFNKRFFVSSTKLLMIFIDTVAFIEYGDVSNCFAKWLSVYTDLTLIDVTAEELWELRNGILHTSTLESRKVRNQAVMRLIPSVNLDHSRINTQRNEKCFDIQKLIKVLEAGLEKWLKTYNDEPSKLITFVERYDKVVSDARVAYELRSCKWD